MKKLQTIILAAALLVGVAAFVPGHEVLASAADTIQQGLAPVSNGDPALETRFKDIVNIMLFIIGAIAVIMIIYGGIRYVTSGGDSSSVKAAKDTILYAVIGLIVAILAYAIVNFVVTSFK